MTRRLEQADLLDKAKISRALPTTAVPLFDVHPRAYALLGGAGLWFLGAMTAAFSEGPGMPILFAICGITVIGYGLIPLMFARMWPTGDARQSWKSFMRRGVNSGSGHLTGGAALAQMLVLPGLMAAWATFILILKLSL